MLLSSLQRNISTAGTAYLSCKDHIDRYFPGSFNYLNETNRRQSFSRLSQTQHNYTSTIPMSRYLFTTFLLLALPTLSSARALLGIDLGSLYMKVALVQSGAPMEIVTNLHSKRKTEHYILFDPNQGYQRFYGADANALVARKFGTTPMSFGVWLGKNVEHPSVQVSIA